MIDIKGNYLLHFSDKKMVKKISIHILPIEVILPSLMKDARLRIFESGVRAVDGLLSCGLGQLNRILPVQEQVKLC